MPRIRKSDVSPEQWEAEKAKRRAYEKRYGERLRAENEMRRAKEQAELDAREARWPKLITELRDSWLALRSEVEKTPSLTGSFERFERSLLLVFADCDDFELQQLWAEDTDDDF